MPIDRLSAADELMLRASAAWPQDIGALAILDGSGLLDATGRFRVEAVQEVIECRLHLVPRLRQVLHHPRRGLGAPLWVDAPGFRLADHLHVRQLEAPAGEAQLERAVEELQRTALDPARSTWEMWFFTGLPDGMIGWFVHLHHAMADGLAAMMTISAFLDQVRGAPNAPAPHWTPLPMPSARELLADNVLRHVRGIAHVLAWLARPLTAVRQVRAAWPATRELLAEKPAPKTSLDRVVGPGRRFTIVRSSTLLVRRIARAHDASVNDVLLALIAGALRTLLSGRGEPVDDITVRIYVPVTLRRRLRGPQRGNEVAQMVVPLPIGVADPHERLRRIAAETAERKARMRPSLGTVFRGRLVSGLILKAVIRQRVNVTSASIPGPRRPLYLAGAPVLEVFPVVALIGNVPLGIGALSCAGTFNIGIAADRDAFPDLDVLAGGVRAELDALGPSAPAHESSSPKRIRSVRPTAVTVTSMTQ
jgi:diacylglycerol O-acyltransferase